MVIQNMRGVTPLFDCCAQLGGDKIVASQVLIMALFSRSCFLPGCRCDRPRWYGKLDWATQM